MTRWSDDRGSVALELALLAPVFLLLLALMIGVGRVSAANSHVDGAAFSAARSASIQRTATTAQTNAAEAAQTYLQQRGLSCQPQNVDVDTGGFTAGLGEQGNVRVDVSCTVPLSEVTGILPMGERTFTATAVSPVDSYRGRQ